MTAQRFPFGDDFRRPVPKPGDLAVRAELERAAHARGFAEGQAAAAAETERRLAEALERLGPAASAAFGELARIGAEVETDAVTFFEAVARTLAGTALAEKPLAGIAEAALATFRHLRGVPHLAVRVHEQLVEGTDELLRRLARESGYEGRIIVLGDTEIRPGDARMEWADGGVLIDRAALDDAVALALAGGPPRPNDRAGEHG